MEKSESMDQCFTKTQIVLDNNSKSMCTSIQKHINNGDVTLKSVICLTSLRDDVPPHRRLKGSAQLYHSVYTMLTMQCTTQWLSAPT